MTVVAAVEGDGGVWIASDSCVTDSDTKDTGSPAKWWSLRRGRVVIGYAGDYDAASMLRAQLDVTPPGRSVAPTEWADAVLLPAIREIVPDQEARPSLIVVTKGAGLVCSGGVYRSRYGYCAIGTGAQAALGSLASTFGRPRNRVLRAVSAAIRHAPECEGRTPLLWVPA